MKKYLDIVLKVVLSLICIMPVMGALHVFPAPTADMYGNPEAFSFVQLLMGGAAYINYMMAFVFLLSVVLLWIKRTALAALLILPITLNIVGFHLFLDSGLLNAGSIPADVLLLLNLYFLWQERARYASLLNPSK